MATVYEFNVDSISCNKCVKRIEGSILAQDPNATITADLSIKTVSVLSTLAVDRVKTLIEDSGYPVSQFKEKK